MFGSYLVELVIGMCFLFAVLGIVTSALTEVVLSYTKVRAKHLQEWLVQWSKQLLDAPRVSSTGTTAPEPAPAPAPAPADPRTPGEKFLEGLLDHPLVASQRHGEARPSYLPSAHLAGALLQTLAMPFSESCVGQDLKSAEAKLRAHIRGLPGEGLKRALEAVLDSAVTKAADGTALIESLKNETASWIDASMGRIEGWTKRRAKLISLVAAFVVCLAFNVSALEVLRVLSSDGAARTELARTAVEYVDKDCSGKADQTRLACLKERSDEAVEALGPLSRLGIGWDRPPAFMTMKDPAPWALAGHALVWLAGLLCAAFAASLGGDFWFKWIGDIVRLTGYKPARRDEPPAEPPGWLARLTARR